MSNCLGGAVGVPGDPKFEKIFKNTVIFGKFALLALLLTLSFINGHKEYIAENPRKFMWDNFTVGALSAAAVAIIAYMRGRSDLIPNLAFVSFLLFFAYNVFRELSGFNAITDVSKLSQAESKERKFVGGPAFILLVLGAIGLSILAFKANVALPSGFGRLAFEAVIFAAFAAGAEILVAKNHDEHGTALIGVGVLNFLMFFYFHIVLQYGGFYNHVFAAGEALHEN